MTVFDNQTPVGSESEVQPDSNQNHLEQLVGEGKKFKDVQALAAGKAESDRMIAELLAKQEGYAQQDYAKELLAKLEEKATVAPVTPQAPLNTSAEGTSQPAQSPEDIESLLNEVLTKRESAATTQANLSTVNSTLTKLYGTEADAKVTAKASELGMSKDAMQAIAAQSPQAFLALLGEAPARTAAPMVEGSINTSLQLGTERDFTYYAKMLKENPRQWKSSVIQRQMIEDKNRLGARFNLPQA